MTAAYLIFVHCAQRDELLMASSVNPELRFRELQEAHFDPLELILVIPGDYEQEVSLKQRFEPLFLRDKWFRADPKLMRFVERLRVSGCYPPQDRSPLWLVGGCLGLVGVGALLVGSGVAPIPGLTPTTGEELPSAELPPEDPDLGEARHQRRVAEEQAILAHLVERFAVSPERAEHLLEWLDEEAEKAWEEDPGRAWAEARDWIWLAETHAQAGARTAAEEALAAANAAGSQQRRVRERIATLRLELELERKPKRKVWRRGYYAEGAWQPGAWTAWAN